jgi:guanylate kinase
MKIEEVFRDIQNQKPKVVYVSGKTCTGKTTFTKELNSIGYANLELDKVVTSSIVEAFNVNPVHEAFITAYRDQGPKEQIEAFIEATKKEIRTKENFSPVVIDGAIARSRILKEIFVDDLEDFYFVYLHPVNFEIYKERIQKRFTAGAANNTSGLPKAFWSLANPADLDEFKKTLTLNTGLIEAIDEYTSSSMEESKERLTHFKESFPDLRIVEI